MSLQQKIDRITDILRRDDGISGAMHYTEQTSWIVFLKFLDDYEAETQERLDQLATLKSSLLHAAFRRQL